MPDPSMQAMPAIAPEAAPAAPALSTAETASPPEGSLRSSFAATIDRIAPTRDERLFLVLSIFIGVISGLLVVAFRIAIEWIRLLTLGSAPHGGQFRLLMVPAAAGLVVAALVRLVFPRRARQRRQSDQGRAIYL